MENDNVNFQLAPEHIHQRNAGEKAIRTWKIISWPYSVALMADF